MEQFLAQNQWVILLLIIWVLPWTPPARHPRLALWKAAKNNHKWWFVALLVINTLAILEILYIFIFNKRRSTNPESFKSRRPLWGFYF
ncbi:MAG: DUF5652 family protein [Patescibacteria group bacterium]|nr:DUF5652 family protein [Patescibacteria group bacterium]